MRVSKRLAYAKINIGLEVLSKRNDGFHNINTAMSLISLADELEFVESKKTEVICLNKPELNGQNNIIYKTINELKKNYYLVDRNFKVILDKKIPIGAGLGGGSSDSATVLKALIDNWELGISLEILKEIAIKIGSDVPFFLQQQSAIVQGKGDIIKYFDYKIPYLVLLVYPRISISTKEAYESINIGEKSKNPTDFVDIIKLSLKSPYILKDFIRNDFEEMTFKKHPIIKEIKDLLYGFGAIFALMSGSGSSVYGFFSNKQEAELAINELSEFDCYLCKGV